jgi:hypothetical protein
MGIPSVTSTGISIIAAPMPPNAKIKAAIKDTIMYIIIAPVGTYSE